MHLEEDGWIPDAVVYRGGLEWTSVISRANWPKFPESSEFPVSIDYCRIFFPTSRVCLYFCFSLLKKIYKKKTSYLQKLSRDLGMDSGIAFLMVLYCFNPSLKKSISLRYNSLFIAVIWLRYIVAFFWRWWFFFLVIDSYLRFIITLLMMVILIGYWRI